MKLILNIVVLFLLGYLFATVAVAIQGTPSEPSKPAFKVEIDLTKAKDLRIIALQNRLARSDYNTQQEKFNQVPEIKTLLDTMSKTASEFNTLRLEVFKAAGVPEADFQKYDIDLDEANANNKDWKPKIVPVPQQPELKRP